MGKKIRIQLTFQICLGLCIGTSLMLHAVNSEKMTRIDSAMVIQEYWNTSIKEYKKNDIFENVNKQKNNTKCDNYELLAKSKREKIFVTGEK